MKQYPHPPADHTEHMTRLVDEFMSHVHRLSTGEALRVTSDAGITLAQMVALYCLTYEGSQSVGALGDRLHLSPSATSHLVERLVQLGFVDRIEDPADRRQKRLTITKQGKELIDELSKLHLAEVAGVVSRLDPAILPQFIDAFDRINAILRTLSVGPQ